MAVMRTSRRLRVEATSEAVTPAQYTVLVHLEGGAQTLSALATQEHVQAPSMTRTVNGLEAAGLVQRIAHPSDGRQVLAELTPAGREILTDTRQRRTEWLDRRLARLSSAERQTLREAAEILLRLSAR
nr:MarR family transcriptional regulator [Psychromicrobium sp. YIM S02556]